MTTPTRSVSDPQHDRRHDPQPGPQRGPRPEPRPRLRPRPRSRQALCAVGGFALAAVALTACSSGDSDGSSAKSGSGSSSEKLSGTVTVFAAASLKESFTSLGKTFEKEHPGTKVSFNFGGSDSLAASITSGAPADVFASASPKTMKTVTDAKAAKGTPATFVRNQLEIATLPGNPKKIATLKDLTGSGLKVALCAKEVPCGAAAQKALDGAGLKLTPVSYEQDVKGALTKVELKEVDASVVYKTDVNAAGGKVEGVEFPESKQAINDYPIALLKNAPNAEAATAFIDLVKSAQGQKVLGQAGFLKP
ncbi:molybdate ABC transporter substrate-binding protein [Streptomyces sp. S465]|uniref:molybdate ABC transporter substrate-binding protein n=1 Tax=Streptomyces sp. S465 TaxID=2979468 RepID=UPI0022A879BC|nr:molybdate ABC transporter substrate-binding protein [Streptomyces sp. S465]WAP57230.1 molybdate ABC transporter substrate-binding protein [Streptomyces sp. S465]